MRAGFKMIMVGVVAAVAAGLFVSVRNDSRIVALTVERDRLAAENAGLQQVPAGRLETPIATVRVTEMVTNNPAGPAADELLQSLTRARVPAAEGPQRIRTLREIVFALESLAHKGEIAVGPVRAFLAGFEDVDFTGELARQEQAAAEAAAKAAEAELLASDPSVSVSAPVERKTNRGGPGGGPRDGAQEGRGRGGRDNGDRARVAALMREIEKAKDARRERARFDFDFPPTLRAGLLEVLARIPVPEAEVALVEVMRSSAKGFEVAYAARLLESAAAGKYRNEAIGAASELLINPPEVAGKTKIDQRQKAYLYSVFDLYGDSSFSDNAQRLLIGADGKIDAYAFQFLLGKLKEGALPVLYAAFNDPGLTSAGAKVALVDKVMPYVGKDSSANAMWVATIGNETLPGQVRAMTIANLLRGVNRRDPSAGLQDTALLEGRLQLVQQMQTTATDETVVRMLGRTAGELQAQITGEPVDRRTRRENRPPGGRPDGGRRPGA